MRNQLKQLEQIRARRRIDTYYPETGPFRRELYAKHIEFFRAGNPDYNAEYSERGVLAGNRIGKTETIGCYELTCHLTGEYPEWWPGYRFDGPIRAWAAGDTNETTRDIIQAKLCGPPGENDAHGTGVIPGDAILEVTPRPGVPKAYQSLAIQHVSGGVSHLGLKSYDQKRKSFQGTQRHVILLDEEPPWDVYEECLMRIMATGPFTGGLILATFTPLSGMSEVVMHFLGMVMGEEDELPAPGA